MSTRAGQILLVAYAWDEQPVTVTKFDPETLFAMVEAAGTIVIHNSFFDRTVLKYQDVHLRVPRIHDTMVMALAHGLPAGLGQLCDVLGVVGDKAKDKRGKSLINLFCKPRPKRNKLRRATEQTHPKEWAEFVEYARTDVNAMRECYRRLPPWNQIPSERELWYLDQSINDRGITIDMLLAHAALRAAANQQELLSDRINKLTSGEVKSATQRDRLMAHLGSGHEHVMADMRKGTVANMLTKDKVSPQVRELLEIRQQASATSPAKYTTLVHGTNPDDNRLRGTLQFCGAARTGRWGGRLFQPQNLPRPTLRQDVIETGIMAMKAGVEDLMFDNVMELCASAVRGSSISARNKKLLQDIGSVTSRAACWHGWRVKIGRSRPSPSSIAVSGMTSTYWRTRVPSVWTRVSSSTTRRTPTA